MATSVSDLMCMHVCVMMTTLVQISTVAVVLDGDDGYK